MEPIFVLVFHLWKKQNFHHNSYQSLKTDTHFEFLNDHILKGKSGSERTVYFSDLSFPFITCVSPLFSSSIRRIIFFFVAKF